MHTILGIDPGTKEMGVAVIRGPRLLATGVHTLRNGERPYDVVGQSRRIILSYVSEFSPEVVAIEKPLLKPTKRAALVSVIGQELEGRAKELGLRLVELSAPEARRILMGNPYAKKLEVAEYIVRHHFPELRGRLPRKPKRAALGFRLKDKYWLHMFDAIGMTLAAGQ